MWLCHAARPWQRPVDAVQALSAEHLMSVLTTRVGATLIRLGRMTLAQGERRCVSEAFAGVRSSGPVGGVEERRALGRARSAFNN
jgi:hypothetical protein